MSNTRTGTIAEGINVYRAAQDEDGDLATAVRSLEERVQTGLGLLQSIRGAIKDWRTHIFSGTLEYSAEAEEYLRQQLSEWLSVSENVVFARVLELEAKNGFNTICGSQDMRVEIGKVKDEIARWTKPVLSGAPGLREDRLTADETNRVFESLRTGSARPKVQPKRISSKP